MVKPIILIVDDEPLIAIMVGATFEDAGFEVRSVLDALGAAEQIDDLGPRLSALVTDIQLGKGPNGWAVATDARMKLPFVPVVYMTGDSAAEWIALGVPGSVLVQKPFVGVQVLTAVSTLMTSNNGDASR